MVASIWTYFCPFQYSILYRTSREPTKGRASLLQRFFDIAPLTALLWRWSFNCAVAMALRQLCLDDSNLMAPVLLARFFVLHGSWRRSWLIAMMNLCVLFVWHVWNELSTLAWPTNLLVTHRKCKSPLSTYTLRHWHATDRNLCYSGTCIKRSPLGPGQLAVLQRWPAYTVCIEISY